MEIVHLLAVLKDAIFSLLGCSALSCHGVGVWIVHPQTRSLEGHFETNIFESEMRGCPDLNSVSVLKSTLAKAACVGLLL